MEEVEINYSLSTTNQYLQLVWVATSLGTFKECPRKFFLSVVRGYRPKPSAIALVFGIALPEGIEGVLK